MSLRTNDVVDLTHNDGVAAAAASAQPKRKKQKTEKQRLRHVYVVIHDKEPQDSGSDYQRSAFLPSRCDTDIVGVFTSYAKAVNAAKDYLVENDYVCDDDDYSDNDDESNDEGWRERLFRNIDWTGDGWFREEEL